MIDNLLKDVRALMGQELIRAQNEHGHTFHSPHEGYGVLMEELDEAREDDKMVKAHTEHLLYFIRLNDRDHLLSYLSTVKRYALLAACEYIQVAAMAQKMEGSMEGNTYERHPED